VIRYFRLFRNISNWWLHFAVKLSLTDADPLLFKTRNNVLVQVPRRLLHEFKEIFLDNCYLRGLNLTIPNDPMIIDVGANAGFFTLFAVSRFPRAKVFSFEPIESNFRQLEINRNLNEGCDIAIFSKSVFGYSGKIPMIFDINDSFTTNARVLRNSEEETNAVQVPCVTLSQIFEEQKIDRCDLLKMDCEGSEYSILYNCPSECFKKITQMAIEVHKGPESNQNMAFLREHLRDHDFDTRQSGKLLWAWQR
jgi:FkbM family methyltransferase